MKLMIKCASVFALTANKWLACIEHLCFVAQLCLASLQHHGL